MNNNEKLLRNWSKMTALPKSAYSSPWWAYNAHVDYDNIKNCNDENCNPYCRCGVLSNIEVTSIYEDSIFQELTKGIDDTILIYCLDRLLQKSGLLNPARWIAEAIHGYYGEEIGPTYPNEQDVKNFDSLVRKLIDCQNDFDKIKLALEAEYQYLLPQLQSINYDVSILQVDTKDIILGNETYMRKIVDQGSTYIKEYTLPRAVCLVQADKYRLIDGYHRTTDALKNQDKIIKIVALSESSKNNV